MSRAHNVQTPGEPSKTDTKAPAAPVVPGQSTPPVDTKTSDTSKPDTPEHTTIKHRAGAAPTKADYANMRAEDIDPTTLTAPVLSKDGYVVPAPKEAK